MSRQPKRIVRKFSKGQVDHVDAWLMSYADMITLLFIVVVIAIPVTMKQKNQNTDEPRGEPPHPYHISDHTGLLSVNTTFDEAYRSLVGIVISNNADEYVAVEKNKSSAWLDISVPFLFEGETADFKPNQMPFIRALVRSLKDKIPPESNIVIEGYTDDHQLETMQYANNWELSSMQTARIAGIMLEEGVDSRKIRITSYANNAPIVPNLDSFGKPIEKNRLRNQRVVVRMENPQTMPQPLSLYNEQDITP